MSKKYSIKYYKDDKPIVRAVGDYTELNVLLSGDAKGCFVNCKDGESLPVKLNSLIADHNKKLLTVKP